QNICSQLCDPLSESSQCARSVGYHYGNSTQSPVLDEAFFNDAGNQIHIDVAAGDNETDVGVDQVELLIDDRCERGGGGPFGDDLFGFCRCSNGVCEFSFVDRDDLVDVVLCHLDGAVAAFA